MFKIPASPHYNCGRKEYEIFTDEDYGKKLIPTINKRSLDCSVEEFFASFIKQRKNKFLIGNSVFNCKTRNLLKLSRLKLYNFLLMLGELRKDNRHYSFHLLNDLGESSLCDFLDKSDIFFLTDFKEITCKPRKTLNLACKRNPGKMNFIASFSNRISFNDKRESFVSYRGYLVMPEDRMFLINKFDEKSYKNIETVFKE